MTPQLDNYYDAQVMAESCKLSNREANQLVRSIAGDKYNDMILSARLFLERFLRKGRDPEQEILRFLPPGSWLGYIVQSALFDIREA